MRNRDTFSGYHPTINFLYFALVLLFSMCLMHPVYLLISLTGALTYDIYLKGRKAVRFAVMGLLPMAALAALVNPAFNHEGATILTYLPSGNPLTLESMLYGAAAAAMLASVVLWFSSYNEVMTSDKFVYLFVNLVRTFGAERVLFGTDSPWADPQTELRHIRALPLSDEEKAAILGGNAKRLLRI